MLEALVNGRLRCACEVEPHALKDLGLGGRAGPEGEHGQGGRDTHGGEEDVLARGLQNQLLVQAEGKVGGAGRRPGSEAALCEERAGGAFAGGAGWGRTVDWCTEAND